MFWFDKEMLEVREISLIHICTLKAKQKKVNRETASGCRNREGHDETSRKRTKLIDHHLNLPLIIAFVTPFVIEAGLQADQQDGSTLYWRKQDGHQQNLNEQKYGYYGLKPLPNRAQNGCIPKSSAVIGSTDITATKSLHARA